MDLREMMMRDMAREKKRERMAADATSVMKIKTNDAAGTYISDEHIIFDSFMKNQVSSDPANGKFAWSLIPGTSSLDPRAFDTIAIQSPLDNIIEAEVRPFAIPYLKEPAYKISYTGITAPIYPVPSVADVVPVSDTGSIRIAPGVYPILPLIDYPSTFSAPSLLTWPRNPYSQTPNGIIAIHIEEAGLQSYPTFGGARHNFELYIKPKDEEIGFGNSGVYPTRGDKTSTFVFTQPLTLPKITLSFYNPDYPLRFEDDVFYGVTCSGITTNAMTIYRADHGLEEGDRIYIRCSQTPNTTDQSLNALIKVLNRSEGFTVTSAALLSSPVPLPMTSDRFMTNPLVVPDVDTSLIINVFVLKRRLRIPIRFRKLMDTTTQGITPV